MPLKGDAKREYQRLYMRRRRAKFLDPQTVIMSKEEVRRMRRAGLDPEQVQTSGSAFNALLLDRDAWKFHVTAHHEARPGDADVLTRIERLEEHNSRLAVRITLLEAERVAEQTPWEGHYDDADILDELYERVREQP